MVVSLNVCLWWLCRTSEELMLYLGCKIGYWRGDIKGLVDDIGEACRLIHMHCHLNVVCCWDMGDSSGGSACVCLGPQCPARPLACLAPPWPASNCLLVAISPKVDRCFNWFSPPVYSHHTDWLTKAQTDSGHTCRECLGMKHQN